MRQNARSRKITTIFTILFLLGATKAALAVPDNFLGFQGYAHAIDLGGSTSLSSPSAIVVDPAGDKFIADTESGSGQIVEVGANGTASVMTISGLSPALGTLAGMAIDGAGNLYVVDITNARVVKVTSSGAGSVLSTGAVTLTTPQGVALDPAGDLFISDGTGGSSRIVEVTAAGSASALAITVASGLNAPKGLAVDVAGALYIADSANNRIVKVASGSTTGTVVSITGGPAVYAPSSVALDRTGNLFICGHGDVNSIIEVDTSGNGYSLSTGAFTLSNTAAGVALDVFGTVYIADTGNSRGLMVDPQLFTDSGAATYASSVNRSAVGFGHLTLGTSTPVTITLPFTTGASSPLGGGVKVFTAGVTGTPTLDFQIVTGDGTTCSSITLSNSSCTVEVSFLPTAPGLRTGAVVLCDLDMNPILTLPLYGWGDAPVAALNPNIGTVVGSTLATANPYEIALDGLGNLYVGVYSGMNVTEIPSGGGSASLISLGSPGGLTTDNITGVALDGAGNLFIGDHQRSRILVRTPRGVVSVLSITGLSSPLGFPTALAFDAAGNLYIADFTNGRIIEVSSLVVAGSTSTGKATVILTGSYSFNGSTLTGMTVDSMGNIYAAARTQNNSKIVKVTAAGVASLLSIPGTITPAISNPQGVGVDAMGNVYIVDTANNRIVRITTAGVATALAVSGLPSPSATLGPTLFGVTVDPVGNLYISDWTYNRIVFVNVSAASLKFPTATKQGFTDTTDGAKTATVANLGNQPLLFSADPTYTLDFVNNSGDTNPCTSSTSLLQGMLCDVSVNFAPQSVGSISANITVTNNTLNVPGSPQLVAASGTGTNPGDTTSTAVTISPSTLVRGQTATLTATISDTTIGHTTTIPTGSVSFSDAVGSTITSLNNGASVSLSGGRATLSGVVLSGIGAHTITANYAGVSGSYLTSSNTTSATLNKASVTVTGPATQPVLVTLGQTGTATVTVTAPYTTITAPSGTVSYSILNASSTSVASGTPTLTVGSSNSTTSIPIPSTLAAGNYTISVTYSGDGSYLASATATTIQLLIGQLTPTIGWTPGASTIAYGTSLSGLLNATAKNGSTTIPGTFVYTATPSGGTASIVTSATILTAASYTLSAAFTPTDSATYQTATGSASLTVTKSAPTIAWTPSASSIAYGSTLSGILDATASFNSNSVAGTFVYTATPSGGTASTVTAASVLGSGSYTLSVTFTPTDTTDYQTATASASLTVTKSTPTIAWTPAASSIAYGSTLSGILDATASFNSNSVAGTFVYTATPSGGTASTVTAASVLGSGSYALSVTFTPTDTTDYQTATASASLTVAKSTPTIAWTPAASSIAYGSTLSGILDATASFNSNSVAGSFVYTATPSGGTASTVTSASVLGSGSYTLSVTFTPTDTTDYQSATGQTTLTVSKLTPTIGLVSSLNPVLVTSAVTFTTTITSSNGAPTGSVSYFDGTTLLTTATVSSGAASYTTSSLAVGTHSITAVYSGSSNFASVTSSAAAESVQDFSVSASTGSNSGSGGGSGGGSSSVPTQTVVPGQTATYNLALLPTNSGTTFPVPITMSVSGLPPGATATVSPQVIPANTVIPNITLSVQLPSSTASLAPKPAPNRQIPPVLWGVLLLPFAGRLRHAGKRFSKGVALLLLLAAGTAAMAGLSGCGASNGFFGQQQQTYTVTVTATAGSVVRNTYVTITVQ